MTLTNAFSNTCKEHKDNLAITFEEKQVTFGQLDSVSNKVAHFFSKLDVKKGDRVAFFMGNCLEIVYVFLGTLKAGAIVVPMNTFFKESEAEHVLHNSGATLIVTDKERLSVVQQIAVNLPTLKHIILAGQLENEISSCEESDPVVDITDDDGAIIFYTSGTTGRSKGALLSHKNMESDLEALKNAWKLSASDKLVLPLPLYHIHGLGVAVSGMLYNGYSTILQRKFNAEGVLSTIEQEQCTLFMAVPTMYVKLLEEQKEFDTSSIRLFISGSAPLSTETFKKFEQRFGHKILERAGMSETNMNFSNPLDGKRKPGTVGLPLQGVEVRITDEKFADVKPGGEGQILLKGPNVFSSYWQNPEKTAESFHEGWFITGDIGKIDQDGYISFLGRSKDLIISGGVNIYPVEIEEIINTHPAVSECAVVAKPDPTFGESVMAYIVLEPGQTCTAQDIIVYCKDGLSSFKKPKHVEFIDQLPRNSMGKVQKNVLREQAKN